MILSHLTERFVALQEALSTQLSAIFVFARHSSLRR
jgi:hypothetical protein